jgi:flagellum-specific ATP synthase
MNAYASLNSALERTALSRVQGRIVRAIGPVLEAELPPAPLGSLVQVGDHCACEVVGFRDEHTILAPLGSTEGVAHGTPVVPTQDAWRAPVGDGLLGRVVDGLGRPIDGKGDLAVQNHRPIHAAPAPAMSRKPLSEPLTTGVKIIDGVLPLARGQRVSITAGSGVGKSTLLAMLAKFVQADVVVVNLIGERGREVREFVEGALGEEGMKKAVIVASTSDRSPIEQIKSTYVATTIAEDFRDQGKHVLLLVDSLTRLALAQRQIGLAAGEPPTTRGYTPSLFAMLPPLLERAGPGAGDGTITAFYTVLVEADDDKDPIADAVRGILDGHICLSRRLASHGHYPAIDVLNSLSRVADRVAEPEHQSLAIKFRHLLATWSENEELVRLGAYRKGANAEVDDAIRRQPLMDAWMRQSASACASLEDTLSLLAKVVG